MPTSRPISSLSAMQSQSFAMLLMKVTQTQGFPLTAPRAYSAVRSMTALEARAIQGISTASNSQAAMQLAHPSHFSGSMAALSSPSRIASAGQTSTHLPQRVQPSPTEGLRVECISSFPAREPHPMPRFLTAPPNPKRMCPLKWETATRARASAMRRAIRTFRKIFPAMGISASSSPRSPSAMRMGTPRAPNPCLRASSRWSVALWRLPR